MASEYPYNFTLAASINGGTLIHSQRIDPSLPPGERSFTLAMLYNWLVAEYGLSGATVNPSQLNYIPAPSGNPQNVFNSFVTASDGSRWYIDSVGRSMLIQPIEYYEVLGTINNEKVTTTTLPDPAIYSVVQINLMLEVFSGGVRLFYPGNYDIDAANNKLVFPFDQGGENAHLILKKLYY